LCRQCFFGIGQERNPKGFDFVGRGQVFKYFVFSVGQRQVFLILLDAFGGVFAQGLLKFQDGPLAGQGILKFFDRFDRVGEIVDGVRIDQRLILDDLVDLCRPKAAGFD
jgi:hypothetical protein